ncbi:hypothetical protein SAMN02927900_04752 [Rhizobium mongolense subsp. loessense]|uniref:Uncharacterized protein n=1 Tax=Rhizobium mongolense subsp. loessense TaxID=158890 RepID=A0A1G4T6V9_9HYPH|nr:hypothetical protein [Rhizobium mongolense]SCW77021.1 hypothetical protein SAMN02927900_04752 [Rhizobium mongolense subsp. loessense]
MTDNTQRFYVDGAGNYLGSYIGSVPDGGIEVSTGPEYAHLKWDFGLKAFAAVPLEELRERMPKLTSRQFWLAAASIGITKASVTATVDSLALSDMDKEMMKIELTEATTFERLHIAVLDLAEALAIPPEQLDALWVWAAGL